MKLFQKYYLALTVRMPSFLQVNHEKFPYPICWNVNTSSQVCNSFCNFYRDLDL